MAGADFALGFILCIFAGLCNGSWQLPLKERCPRMFRIVTSASEGWQFENVWLVYSFMSSIFAIVLAYGLLGSQKLNKIYDSASEGEVALVCMFCILWGVGSFGFGLAVKMLGMAIGTSLCMGVVLVLGTLLPLLVDNLDQAHTSAFIWTLVGVAFGIAGFSLSAVAGSHAPKNSLSRNEMEVQEDKRINDDNGKEVGQLEIVMEIENAETHPIAGEANTTTTVNDDGAHSAGIKGVIVAIIGGAFAAQLQFSFVFGKPLIREAEDQGASEFASTQAVWLLAFTLGGFVNCIYSIVELTNNSTWNRFVHSNTNILVSNSGTATRDNQIEMSACRNGHTAVPSEDDLSIEDSNTAKESKTKGTSQSSSNNEIDNITNVRAECTTDGDVEWAQLIRNGLLSTGIAVTWMAHILIYGYAQSLMGELGAGIAWPLIMISTVSTGQLWSLFLGEWNNFSEEALKLNKASLSVQVCAVIVIALGNSL